jgi:two-component system response regulator CpxR
VDSDNGSASILIAEDDPAVCHMLELAFSMEGFATEVVQDGHAAAARLAGPPADLVILDVMLPHLDGFTVLRRLREHAAWRDTKVVVSTALASDEDVWRGWSSGADYYLVKPFDLDHLREVVHRLLTGSPIA